MSIDIESASRDELVEFYNANKDEEAESLSIASSKDAAKVAVEALLAAEADQSVEAAAAEAAADDGFTEPSVDASLVEEAAADTPGGDDEPDSDESYDDSDQAEAPTAATDEEEDEDDFLEAEDGLTFDDELDEEFCDMCGGAGMIPRCPTCATERRTV